TIALVFSRGVLVDSRQPFAWNQAVIRCRQPHEVSCWTILLQNDFWCWNEEQFSRTEIEIWNFDSQNRPFGFYYCRISLAGRLRGDFCNNIGPERLCSSLTPARQLSKVLRTKCGFRRWSIAVPKPRLSKQWRADHSTAP